MTLKSDLRAEEYRAQALAAATAAEGCALERVREQHRLAAARWTELAEGEERRARNTRVYLGSPRSARETQTMAAERQLGR